MRKTAKTILSVLLSLLMTISVFGGLTLSADAAALTITTAAQLRSFLSNVAGGTSYENQTVELGADIDLGSQNMSGVQGNANNGFKGTFNGNGHTISNFYLSASGDYWGLFRYTTGNAAIKNLTFVNAQVSSNGSDVAVVSVVPPG